MPEPLLTDSKPAAKSRKRAPASDRPPLETEERVLFGWGRTAPSRATVVAPEDPSDVSQSLSRSEAVRGVIPRGLGRSYGDAAQCAGGLVIDTQHLDTIGQIDQETGAVDVGAGVSLDALLRVGLKEGWFLPVSPGTRQVSIGGAIAADVHGKNHHSDGSFCAHVSSITLSTPTGVQEVGPQADPDLFWATAGGMGLTGVVTQARVQLRRVETSWMRVDTERHGDLGSLMSALERVDAEHRYSVAWVDCSARRRRLGRGILDAGDHASVSDLTGRRVRRALDPPPERALKVPSPVPPSAINPVTVAAFNQAWYLKSPSRRAQLRHLSGFFHPLDTLANWNVVFGRRGFVQYQFVVGEDQRDVVARSIEALQRAKCPVTIAVLKRFGPGNPGPLSFPIPGWTLALDLPVGPPGLRPALRALDEMVASVGGRVYLAKDARLDRDTFRAMYPRLGDFEAVRRRVDPHGVLRSDLSRRLGIGEERER